MVGPGFALIVFFGITLLLALLAWPGVGVAPRLLRRSRLGERVRLEDALKHVFMCQQSGQVCSLESLAGRLEVSTAQAAPLLSRLEELGLVQVDGDGPVLTHGGVQTAVRIVRTHRLWERYLADRTGVPPIEWHDQAERMEHSLSPEQTDRLESRLGHPSWDPHGDPIPTSDGEIPPAPGIGLLSADTGCTVEVVHLEDEPREIYDALLDDGLVLGGRLAVIARTDRGVRVRSGGREWTLDSIAARNVSVRKLPAGTYAELDGITLLDVQPGETVRVVEISGACQGTQRRRLLDLGVVRGAEITPELVSAAGDPVAYRIRGALIALRGAQASRIAVERTENQDAAEVA